MKIDRRIFRSVSVSVVVSLVILLILMLLSQQTRIEAARGRLYTEIKNRVDSLNILISQSPERPGRRRARQIINLQQSIEDRLDALSPRDSLEATLIGQIRANSLDLSYSLDKLIAAWNKTLHLDRYNVLVSQLAMKAQFISDDTHLLAGISQARVDAAHSKANYLTFALVVALILANAAISFFFGRSVVQGEQKLGRALVRAEDSEQKYRELIETANSIILRYSKDGTIRFVNDFGLHFLGYTAEELLGQDIITIVPKVEKSSGRDLVALVRDVVIHPELYRTVPIENITKDGRAVWVTWTNKAIFDDAGEVFEILAIGNDITALKKAEEVLQANLTEKEVLLKEIHHRVKNNMQVISSLVNMQAYEVEDPVMRAIFQDITYRVRSMAMIHEKLYQSTDLAQIDFADYIKSLFGYLQRAHESAAADINVEYHLQPILLSVNAAVPCGLILNELFSNVYKHAFAGRKKGVISVSLVEDEQKRVHISVADNGIGLPLDLDWKQSQSLGLRIVRTLVRQLRGELEVGSEEGSRFTVSFDGYDG